MTVVFGLEMRPPEQGNAEKNKSKTNNMQKNALQDSNIKIQKVPVGDLRPAEYNPRTWDKEAERQLKESIARFGIVDPLLANARRIARDRDRRPLPPGGLKELGIRGTCRWST